jgi:uncharacterized protein (TIGR00645 family)
MDQAAEPGPVRAGATGGGVDGALQRTLFASRWLLAPLYLGLAACLVLLLIQFAREGIHLAVSVFAADDTSITLGVLSLIDLSLLANLLLLVVFGGYESFVARLEDGPARLSWMGRVGFGDLKLRLLASIVAIAAIQALEAYMKIGQISNRDLAWRAGLLLAFSIAALLLAATDRLAEAH